MSSVTLAMIDAAADATAVQKLQAKIQLEQAALYEAELQAVAAHRLAEAQAATAYRVASLAHQAALEAIFSKQAAAAEAMLVTFRQQGTAFDASERGLVVSKVFDALVGKYMTPGTATDPATQTTDAARDANYLKVAVQSAMGVYDALRTPVV